MRCSSGFGDICKLRSVVGNLRPVITVLTRPSAFRYYQTQPNLRAPNTGHPHPCGTGRTISSLLYLASGHENGHPGSSIAHPSWCGTARIPPIGIGRLGSLSVLLRTRDGGSLSDAILRQPHGQIPRSRTMVESDGQAWGLSCMTDAPPFLSGPAFRETELRGIALQARVRNLPARLGSRNRKPCPRTGQALSPPAARPAVLLPGAVLWYGPPSLPQRTESVHFFPPALARSGGVSRPR